MPIKPRSLHTGSRIGIISPARHAPDNWIAKGKAALEAKGFVVVVHPQNNLKDFQLAGTDKQRAQAINDFFKDPGIDAIMAPRGGIGSYRLLPHLDYDAIRANPKIFCGFSDITTLLNAIHKRTGLVTFHGPLLISFTEVGDPKNIDYFTDFFTLSHALPLLSSQGFQDGVGQGALVGGNITLLQGLIGTKDDFDTAGKIFFIEDDDGEKPSDIDRALWHLKNAGKFDEITGLIVGEFTGFREDKAGAWKHDVPALLRELIPSHIPIATNFPCAHGDSIVPLPIGINTRLEITGNKVFLTFLETPFA